MFKEKIEEPNQYNVPILAQLEIKSIFGKIPPIYDIHCKIRDELSDLINNWKEDALVGDVILKHVSFVFFFTFCSIYALNCVHTHNFTDHIQSLFTCCPVHCGH